MGETVSRPPTSDKMWVRDMLKVKAGTDWVQSELNALRAQIQEQNRRFEEMSRAISTLEQNSREHRCDKEDDLDELKKWKNQSATIKVAAVIAFVALLAGGMAQYFSLTNSVSNTQDDVTEIKGDVQLLTVSQRNLENTVSKQGQKADERQQTQWIELKSLLENVADAKKDKRRRK